MTLILSNNTDMKSTSSFFAPQIVSDMKEDWEK